MPIFSDIVRFLCSRVRWDKFASPTNVTPWCGETRQLGPPYTLVLPFLHCRCRQLSIQFRRQNGHGGDEFLAEPELLRVQTEGDTKNLREVEDRQVELRIEVSVYAGLVAVHVQLAHRTHAENHVSVVIL